MRKTKMVLTQSFRWKIVRMIRKIVPTSILSTQRNGQNFIKASIMLINGVMKKEIFPEAQVNKQPINTIRNIIELSSKVKSSPNWKLSIDEGPNNL